MGNPSITRLGVQQFWYNHWYSDKFFSKNLQQDKLFENLIHLYLTYGLNLKENIFLHEYWYNHNKTIKSKRLNYSYSTNKIFYRRYFYSNKIVGIEHNFLLRNNSSEFFPLKLWLFKYNNWIICNLNWFKPIKGKHTIAANIDSASAANVLHKPSSYTYKKTRLKLLVLYLTTNILKLNKKYVF